MAKRTASSREGPRKRREEVLQAAAEMFYERGYDATTTRDITERLGLLKGSLYYYIDTKEDLLFSVMQDALEAGISSLKSSMEGTGPAVEKLRRFVQSHIVFLTEHLVGATLVLHEHRSLSEAHREIVSAELAAYQHGVSDLIEAGQAEGSIRADLDPNIAALGVLGAVNWLYRWYQPGGSASPEEIGRHLAGLVVDGLAVPQSPAGTPTARTPKTRTAARSRTR